VAVLSSSLAEDDDPVLAIIPGRVGASARLGGWRGGEGGGWQARMWTCAGDANVSVRGKTLHEEKREGKG